MPLYEFPNPEVADEYGVVGVGTDLRIENLLNAYRNGIFPWPIDEMNTIPWFCPNPRGILEFSEFKIPSRLKRELKKIEFTHTINRDFEFVIEQCSKAKRKDQASTWINESMKKSYIQFHHAGYAHSVETWINNKCVGGLYGVYVDGVFSGESMFHLVDHASKSALIFLIEKLKRLQIKWIDTQMVTPLLEQFGAKEISRKKYLKKLKEAQDSLFQPF